MRLYNEPVRIEPSRYRNAIERYLVRASRVKGVRSVYTMGGVGAPGLSDIDIVVVTEDQPSDHGLRGLSVRGIDDYLFLHGPVIIPISLVDEFQRIIYGSNLALIEGNDHIPGFDELEENEKFALGFAYLIDFVESRFTQYASARNSGLIDMRHWHARIWSATHSAAIWENVLGGQLELDERAMLSSIVGLRNAWLAGEAPTENDFMKAFYASENFNKSIFVKALSAAYSSSVIEESCHIKPVRVGNKRFIFESPSEFPEYHERRFSLNGRGISSWICNTSPLYWRHMCNYSSVLEFPISQKERSASINEDIIRRHYLQKRASSVGAHWKWLSVNAAKSGSMTGYLGSRPNRFESGSEIIASTLHRLQLLW